MPNSGALNDIDEPVDAVVMWVDGSDPAFVASRAEHLRAVDPTTSVHDGAGRHRDNDELRYLLRAIDANMAWIRRIYIVTNGQVPSFVDFSDSRVELVTHREIFPDPDTLPNFNSFAIESCLHHIPGLTERFVRFSDDFFVCVPVSKREMLGQEGFGVIRLGSKIRLPGSAQRPYDQQLAANATRIFDAYGYYPQHNFLHTPQVRERSYCQQLIDRWATDYEETRRRRFRGDDDCLTLFLYPFFVLSEHSDARINIQTGRIEHPDVQYPWSSTYRQIQVGATKIDWRSALGDMIERPPTFLNLNDSFGETPEDADLELYKQFLDAMFPEPASLELPLAESVGQVT